LALERGRRRCSVLDERYREDMPRARRRVSGGSPVGWGRGPTFAAVADTMEAAEGGWAGEPGIIAIDHKAKPLKPSLYFIVRSSLLAPLPPLDPEDTTRL